jgi:hypothetical protein
VGVLPGHVSGAGREKAFGLGGHPEILELPSTNRPPGVSVWQNSVIFLFFDFESS